jgi:hypothetical protein
VPVAFGGQPEHSAQPLGQPGEREPCLLRGGEARRMLLLGQVKLGLALARLRQGPLKGGPAGQRGRLV